MSSHGNFISTIQKLKGRENFADWKFGVKTYLEHEDLWKHIEEKTPVQTSLSATSAQLTAANEAKQTKLKLVMLVEPVIFVHIQDAETPADVWEKLETTFEDNGLTRRLGLIRQFSTKLSECETVHAYVNKIMNASHNLRNIGMDLSDEFVGTLLLVGLPDEYRPMIMGIEISGMRITADFIKTKLLYEQVALAATFKKRNFDISKVRCFNCNKYGHFFRECVANRNDEQILRTSFVAHTPFENDDWYIDSSASCHMTRRKENLFDTCLSPNEEVVFADNSRMKVECSGSLRLSVANNMRSESVLIRNVRYVPDLCANLLSVSQMVKRGNTVIFNEDGCRILDAKKELVATAILCNGMYKFNRGTEGECFSAREAEPFEQFSSTYWPTTTRKLWRATHSETSSVVIAIRE